MIVFAAIAMYCYYLVSLFDLAKSFFISCIYRSKNMIICFDCIPLDKHQKKKSSPDLSRTT